MFEEEQLSPPPSQHKSATKSFARDRLYNSSHQPRNPKQSKPKRVKDRSYKISPKLQFHQACPEQVPVNQQETGGMLLQDDFHQSY